MGSMKNDDRRPLISTPDWVLRTGRLRPTATRKTETEAVGSKAEGREQRESTIAEESRMLFKTATRGCVTGNVSTKYK